MSKLAGKLSSDTEGVCVAVVSQAAQLLSLIPAALLLFVWVGPAVPQNCGIPGVPGIPGTHGENGKDGMKGELGDPGEPIWDHNTPLINYW